tara:strand:- start:24 stop:407 length:384 start_codon:yes stop_codon:yes gene_type:complete
MQKAKLKLPVKQFHQLYDFLGEILDHEAETNDFNMENTDVELIEDIRTELFNQIPDEKPTEITYAFTTVKELSSITPIKLYEIDRVKTGGFLMQNDRGSQIFCIDKGCSHLSSDQSKDWNFITITND